MKQNKDRMRKIGITGGVGSGKSRVLDYLKEECHACVYQADILAHQVQQPGTECYHSIIDYFGEEIVRPDEAIDREKLGRIVFTDREKLLKLNAMVHPAVNREILRLMEEEEQRGTRLFVLEAALLTEKVYREMLDEIWYIYTQADVRKRRLAESRGYTADKTEAMFAAQASEAVYRENCDRVIDNSGLFEETIEAVKKALREESDRRIYS